MSLLFNLLCSITLLTFIVPYLTIIVTMIIYIIIEISIKEVTMKYFEVPPLPYSYDFLEPVIDCTSLY